MVTIDWKIWLWTTIFQYMDPRIIIYSTLPKLHTITSGRFCGKNYYHNSLGTAYQLFDWMIHFIIWLSVV